MANYVFDGADFVGYDKKIKKGDPWLSYPSVTAIIGQLDKSSALIPWAQKMTCDYIVEHWDECQGLEGHKLTNFMDDARKVALQKRDEAGQYGTDLHKLFASALLGEDIDTECRDDVEFYCAIEDWKRDKNFNVALSNIETPIVNVGAGYAGSIDFYDGENFVLYDLKTSKSVYDSHILQLAGYWEAIKILIGERCGGWADLQIPACAKILHWDKEELVLSEIDLTKKVERQVPAFLLLVDLYYALKTRRVKNARTEKK